MKSRRVSIKTRSPPASLPLKGQVTRHTIEKWPIWKQEWNFNYTSLPMRHYIYSSKLNNKVIDFQEFIDKLLMNYNHEDFC